MPDPIAVGLRCAHCGALLQQPQGGERFVTCAYCGHVHALRDAAAGQATAPPAAHRAGSQRHRLLALVAAGALCALVAIGAAGWLLVRAPARGPGPRGRDAPAASSPVRLSTASRTFAEGADIVVHFDPPLSGAANGQHWIAIVDEGAPDEAWGSWRMLDRGARSVTLAAPKPGAYEIRLHDQYPRFITHVVGRLGVVVEAPRTVEEGDPEGLRARAGEKVRVRFEAPIAGPEDERHWITVAPVGSPDSTWGAYQYVERGATSATVDASEPGRFEIRLHDGYPARMHHVVRRWHLEVSAR